MKVAVVGIGGTGSAALRFLAREGHDATGFEQFEVGHTRGSSHGESRIIRYTYPDALYTRLMRDAYPLWDELEREAEEELFGRCGGVYFGSSDYPKVQATENALRESGLDYELCAADETNARLPGLHLRPNEIALFQKSSGFLRAGSCVRANARLAKSHGATINQNTRVLSLASCADGVLIACEQDGQKREEFFQRVLVTAGAWMSELFSALHLPLCVTRQQFVYVRAKSPASYAPENFPVWIDAAGGYYGFPADGREEGIKFARHDSGEEFDPNRSERPISESELRAATEYSAKRLPNLTGEVLHAQACLYTSTPDEDFIIDRAPNLENVFLISGCSGHGFKFTVLLGRIGANLAIHGDDPRDLSRFALTRFGI
jgi:sarcosine oxidase